MQSFPTIHVSYLVVYCTGIFLISAIDNWRVQNELADRRAFDEQAFREAGGKKAQRTYKFDPTKPLITKKQR